ncbi:uncharacterized protein METZ01_LOCUS360497, partial [marine metagenome]
EIFLVPILLMVLLVTMDLKLCRHII